MTFVWCVYFCKHHSRPFSIRCLVIHEWKPRVSCFCGNGSHFNQRFLISDPHIFPHLPGKVGHILALLYRKWNTKRWTVECMAFGSGWQIHYCFTHSSKQSKCCFGEWAVTDPAPRQHHTININKREKVRCPGGECSEVHELEMSPISLGEGEQVCSMLLTSFLHKQILPWGR